jgi:VanZ family protein
MLPLARPRPWIFASVALVAAVVIGSLGPMPDLPPVPVGLDKLQHFGAYLVLALWFTGLFRRSYYARVALALLGLGLSLELIQHVMRQGRYGELLDMGANALGVAAGVALALWQTGGWAPRVESWLRRR